MKKVKYALIVLTSMITLSAGILSQTGHIAKAETVMSISLVFFTICIVLYAYEK